MKKKLLWLIFGRKVGQSDPIVMESMCGTGYWMYTPSFTLISQLLYNKSPENFLLVGSPAKLPLWVFLSTRGPTIAQPWRKSVGVKILTI